MKVNILLRFGIYISSIYLALTFSVKSLYTCPSKSQLSRLITSTNLYKSSQSATLQNSPQSNVLFTGNLTDISPKSVTKDIVAFYNQYPRSGSQDAKSKYVKTFSKYLSRDDVKVHIDGMHVITILFQSARVKKMAKNLLPIPTMVNILKEWNREWSERDISTFVYGIRSFDCYSPDQQESALLLLAAQKISESTATFTSSRSIGNALYGLQDITSDIDGVKELCSALAKKIDTFVGDLSGQDIGIGIYGLQGMTADVPEVRNLIGILAKKIKQSESEFDSQALSNALYGLQSMTSDHREVLDLVSALATKVSQARTDLIAQAIGSALYGLQRLSSDALEVRTLVATLAEKIEASTVELDAQAIGNSLFGLQRMKSNSPEVRALVQALTTKIVNLKVPMDSPGIGAAIYGLNSMNSESPQVRALLSALADQIIKSNCDLSGQAIADSLYGLRGMTEDCPELRKLLSAISDRIDATRGKLEAQELGNALYGLQSLSSENEEVRKLVSKLAEKVKRSRAYLRPQHIARAMLGFQRLSSTSPEVRTLISQMSKRIAESDRTPLTAAAIADSLFGLQGMTSDVPEVQDLVGELAKKVSSTAAVLSPAQIGRALFGLQGLSSTASIFAESALGLDSDEVQFLLSALWDKIKISREAMPMSAVAMGLQGLTLLNDPIASNIKQYLYLQLLQLPASIQIANSTDVADGYNIVNPIDVIATVRGLSLNNMAVPDTIWNLYDVIDSKHRVSPYIQLSRQDRLIVQKYLSTNPTEKELISNVLIDGIRSDMFFMDIGLLVELDGAQHKMSARARYDSVRDEYLSKRLGLKVRRITLEPGFNTENIVKQIKITVDEMRDKKVEKEIQQIYASEKELQRIYSAKK